MNWTNFLLILTLLYLTYYGLNLLYDLFRARKPIKNESAEELLFFDEDIQPQLILPKEEPQQDVDRISQPSIDMEFDYQILEQTAKETQASTNPIQSTGAVSLKELFSLAKINLIEYTGEISY
ncbi:hypothetical protein [Sphingobacterium bovistauri]|uniref:Uncharacterized protein n=1 Tax=Sphingobacterium bovistauri TaxID=2781959 RepID=A0ABS7Z7H5_9SPHI|nr:hypothetical protein [Sphingobacterium bovistauri]MCA5006141.1 hypothetical protein [Sphingobacterium bovistauri]